MLVVNARSTITVHKMLKVKQNTDYYMKAVKCKEVKSREKDDM